MIVPGFLGPTYPGRSTNFVSDRTVNFFPELNNAPNPKSSLSLIGTPGLRLVDEVGSGPIRGSHVFDGKMYFVSGNTLYRMDSGENMSSPLGSLSTSSGPVQMEDNGVASAGIGGDQLAIVDGSYLYIFDLGTDTLTQQVTTWSPSTISYLDGYFIVTDLNTMSYYVSDLYDGTTWNALATSPVSASPDNLMACCSPHQELWLIKSYTTEAWYDAGTATSSGSPFSRISGAVIDYGTPAPHSVVVGDRGVIMLAQVRIRNEASLIGVVEFSGYTAVPIMPQALVYKVQHLTRVDDAVAWMYASEGHVFYVLTFPTDNVTLVYDTTTQMWHERSSYLDNPYVITRHRLNSISYFNQKHYVGDYSSGKMYEMNTDYYDEDGDPIVSMRITPTIVNGENMENVFIHRLFLDMETGVGTSDGLDPVVELSWSNDGGHTFLDAYQATASVAASAGKQGYYKKELKWRRLGYSRNRVWKLVISDKVKKVLIDGHVEVSQ